jgi:serine/threonine-protein kinase
MTSDFVRQAFGSFGSLGPGRRIAGYVIEEQIGAGGMAVVFRARDEALGRLAAVKVIAPSMADDQEFRARFLRESRAAAAIDSPHIVPVYAAGEAAGLLYIATRFVPGGDLAGLTHRAGGRLSAAATASFVTQLASALDAAHAAGLVHRDVKPANVLVDRVPGLSEHAYLSDFGLSKGTHATELTATGQFLGTPDYSAPEQISGGYLDGRADQYSLGCLAFTLLTGTPPFHRAETLATLFAHIQAPVPPATGLRPELPAAVDGVIARALAKSPDRRYARCGDFAAALRQALDPARDVTAPGWRAAPLPGATAPVSGTGVPSADRTAATWSSAAAATTIPPGNGAAAYRAGPARHGRGRGPRRTRTIWAAAAAVLATGIVAAAALHAWPQKTTASIAGYRVLTHAKYGFVNPWAVVSVGGHVWVANGESNSLAELNASDASLVRTLSGGKYGFDLPQGIAYDSTHLWVLNEDSVTELNASDGSWVRTLSGSEYGFKSPVAIACDGAHVWVTNAGGNSVTELSASDGSWIRTLSGSDYGFKTPWGIAAGGGHIWVANSGSSSVTELSASDGSKTRTLSGGKYRFNGPQGITVAGGHLWVTNPAGDTVTELSASDGSWIKTLAGGGYGFSNPYAIVADGPHVWVSSTDRSAVTELNASDGSLVQLVSGAKYGFANPIGIAADDTHVWVLNPVHSWVTELTIG